MCPNKEKGNSIPQVSTMHKLFLHSLISFMILWGQLLRFLQMRTLILRGYLCRASKQQEWNLNLNPPTCKARKLSHDTP